MAVPATGIEDDMMQFAASIALGLAPLLVFGATAMLRPTPAPVAPKPVQTEGVTARRMDDATFRRRWPADLPPAITRAVPVATVAAPAVPPARIVRRALLGTDVCARHGQRRVEYLKRGYKHWRCRR